MAVGLLIYFKARAFKAHPENPKAKKFGIKAKD